MVKICKLKLTLLQQAILRHLYINAGESFNARDLALALNVSQPAISKALPKLKKEELITVTKDKRFSITLNRENPFVIGLKRADNLKQLYESGFVEYLYNSLPGATAILFGSYATGEDTLTSDIDIAIIGVKENQLDLSEFEKYLKREIILNFYSEYSAIEKPLLNNILNGITIKGAVELEKV